MTYQLQKYKGRSTRFVCPMCGMKDSFTLYVDENNNPINDNVGRCNHESSCGYHYTPKQWFENNPNNMKCLPMQYIGKPKPAIEKIDYIPYEYVVKSLSYNSDFIEFLKTILDDSSIKQVVDNYNLGATKDRDVIFWLIDINGKVRSGKQMKYNPQTGRRVKELGGIQWIHKRKELRGIISNDYNLKQCLFGEHLLSKHPSKTVAIVESEKSAIICSTLFSDCIWLATGGKSQLSPQKMQALKRRNVLFFPDVDGYAVWCEKVKDLPISNATVSDLLENRATDDERERKIDIADWVISELRNRVERLPKYSPQVQLLIDRFELEEIV